MITNIIIWNRHFKRKEDKGKEAKIIKESYISKNSTTRFGDVTMKMQ